MPLAMPYWHSHGPGNACAHATTNMPKPRLAQHTAQARAACARETGCRRQILVPLHGAICHSHDTGVAELDLQPAERESGGSRGCAEHREEQGGDSRHHALLGRGRRDYRKLLVLIPENRFSYFFSIPLITLQLLYSKVRHSPNTQQHTGSPDARAKER